MEMLNWGLVLDIRGSKWASDNLFNWSLIDNTSNRASYNLFDWSLMLDIRGSNWASDNRCPNWSILIDNTPNRASDNLLNWSLGLNIRSSNLANNLLNWSFMIDIRASERASDNLSSNRLLNIRSPDWASVFSGNRLRAVDKFFLNRLNSNFFLDNWLRSLVVVNSSWLNIGSALSDWASW